jgi:CRP-like cAMP-binding protein
LTSFRDCDRAQSPPRAAVGPPTTLSNRESAGQVARRASIENSLLAVVPRKEYRRLTAGLEPVTLTFGDVLYEPWEPIRHVYFPNKSLVSLLTLADGHLALEVGLIGRQGMVGIPLVLRRNVSSVRALVQGSGTAMRMASAHFRKEFRFSLPLQQELYRYTHALMAPISQTAACNRFHVVETRLARWLLMTNDRVKSDQFRMTHEFLGHMLGVRRVGVTKAAHALQMRKLISYSRGDITVLDRRGLEAAACECYEIVKHMHDVAQAGHEMRKMRLSAGA